MSNWYNLIGQNSSPLIFSDSLTVDSSGNVIVAGQHNNGVNQADQQGFLYKLDTSGSLVWEKSVIVTTSGQQGTTYCTSPLIDGSGNIWTGIGWAPGTSNVAAGGLLKFNSSGVLQSSLIFYDSSTSFNYAPAIIRQDSSGNLYVIGNKQWTAGDNTICVVTKINSSNVVQWTTSVTNTVSSGSTNVADLTVDGSGNVILAVINKASSGANVCLQKLNGSNGNFISGTLVNLSTWNNDFNSAGGMVVDSSGNFYILSANISATFGSDTSFFIFKFNSSFTSVWSKKFTPTSTATSPTFFGYSLAIDGSDNMYVLGDYNVDNTSFNGVLCVMKIDTSGAILWTKNISAPSTANIYDQANANIDYTAIAVSGSQVLVCGSAEPASGTYGFTASIPTDGSVTSTSHPYQLASVSNVAATQSTGSVSTSLVYTPITLPSYSPSFTVSTPGSDTSTTTPFTPDSSGVTVSFRGVSMRGVIIS